MRSRTAIGSENFSPTCTIDSAIIPVATTLIAPPLITTIVRTFSDSDVPNRHHDRCSLLAAFSSRQDASAVPRLLSRPRPTLTAVAAGVAVVVFVFASIVVSFFGPSHDFLFLVLLLFPRDTIEIRPRLNKCCRWPSSRRAPKSRVNGNLTRSRRRAIVERPQTSLGDL